MTYLHGHEDAVMRSHRWRTVANSLAFLEPHLLPGRTLLDVGCGPGTITAELAERLGPGRVVGIDAAADAVAMATAEAGERGVDARFEVADVMALGFPDGAFDVVVAHQVLQHLADPVGALAEMRRVCAPGGVVAVRDSDYPAFAFHPELPELTRAIAVYCAAARSVGGHPDAGRRLLGWAQAAGFGEVSATASAWCFAAPEDRSWWGELWAERMTSTVLAERMLATGTCDQGDLEGFAAGWRAWAAAGDGCFIVPHGELICSG